MTAPPASEDETVTSDEQKEDDEITKSPGDKMMVLITRRSIRLSIGVGGFD